MMAKGACVLCGKVWSRETRKARLTAAGDVYRVRVRTNDTTIQGLPYRLTMTRDLVVCVSHNESCEQRSFMTYPAPMTLATGLLVEEKMKKLRGVGCAFKAVSA